MNKKIFESYQTGEMYFLGKEYDASNQTDLNQVKKDLKVDYLFLPWQKHTDIFRVITDLEANINQVPADALVLKKSVINNNKIALAIKTADCLPILVQSQDYFAVIHAGWQGLKSEIATKALSFIRENDLSTLELCVGPAASVEHYEFGKELIGTIPQAVSNNINGSTFLDLEKTLKMQVNDFADLKFNSVDICTIKDANFHSHRRERGDAGRNLSLISF